MFLYLAVYALAQQAQTPPPNPFAAPQATAHYAPDRDYDLLHIALDLKIDHEKLAFQGTVVNTLAPLREDLTAIRFHCAENLNVQACEIAGQNAPFRRESAMLTVTLPQPLTRGKPVAVSIHYTSGKEHEGFHWIKPTPSNPQRVGFYTESEMFGRRYWIPTWDYPNDFVTSETRVTVPADWYVVGNGTLTSNTLNSDKKTRTFHWKMEQRHATYLLSLAGGPFDIQYADWRGVLLMYAVPKGKGSMIKDTFGETPDMLSFFSDITGVKFPWPKYAQSAMYDYTGGMEWVSATTMGENALSDKRSGYRVTAGLVSHELSHQWFGDLVTCRDWGHLWLNEGFASFFSVLYGEHARGKNFYDQGIEGGMQGYISQSRRYKRPLATNFYSSPSAMFDAHTYAKGGVILHTLRRYLGDKAFFEGLHHYLTKFRHTPVDTHDFCDAMTEATGINLEPFFEQWVYKPGHPILDYGWKWDDARQEVVLTVKQTQDTKDGTPIYDLNSTVGLISGSNVRREKARLNKTEQEIRFGATRKPDALLLDPDHDFLREVPTLHWATEEWLPILQNAPTAVDREIALTKIAKSSPSDALVQAVTEAIRADRGQFPIFRSIASLGELKREDLRPMFREQIMHPSQDRREQAIRALGLLAKDPADIRALRGLITDREPYAVVRAALSTLGNWDAPGNRDVFQKAAQMRVERDPGIRLLAHLGLAKAGAAEGKAQADPEPETTVKMKNFFSDVANVVKDSQLMTPAMSEFAIPRHSSNVAGWLKELKSFVFVMREDVEDRGMVRRGARINRIFYYQMVTGQMTQYPAIYLTAEGKVADLDFFRE